MTRKLKAQQGMSLAVMGLMLSICCGCAGGRHAKPMNGSASQVAPGGRTSSLAAETSRLSGSSPDSAAPNSAVPSPPISTTADDTGAPDFTRAAYRSGGSRSGNCSSPGCNQCGG